MKEFKWDDIPAERRLDYRVMRDSIDGLFAAYDLKVEREWPQALSDQVGMVVYVRAVLLIVRETYEGILTLCADTGARQAPLQRYVAVGPMARTILEAAFNIAYLCDSPEKHWSRFIRAGWRDEQETFERLEAVYGCDEQWQDWFANKASLNAWLAEQAGITATDRAQLNARVQWQPRPSKIIKALANADTRRRMEYLDAWFYHELSAQSHLDVSSVLTAGVALIRPEKHVDSMKKLRSDAVSTSVLAVLIVFSELVLGLGLDHRSKLVELWSLLSAYSDQARHVYEGEYAVPLGRIA